jgi:hypothetical protein
MEAQFLVTPGKVLLRITIEVEFCLLLLAIACIKRLGQRQLSSTRCSPLQINRELQE